MIYMESTSLSWRPIFTSWLNLLPTTLTKDHKQFLVELFERFIDPCITYLRRGGLKKISSTIDLNLVRSLMNILDCLFDKFHDPKTFLSYNPKEIFVWFEGMFFFALIWSIGITCDSNSRTKFDSFLRKVITSGINDKEKREFNLLNAVPPPSRAYSAVFPDSLTVYDYQFISDESVCLT